MRQPKRKAAEIPLARFEGPRWAVAMCEGDWVRFGDDVPSEANERLTVIFEHLCRYGEDHLPKGVLRWMTPRVGDHAGVVTGAFESRGVVVHGRRSVVEGRATFFVTGIVVDPPAVEPEQGRGRGRGRARGQDGRQGLLPLDDGGGRGR